MHMHSANIETAFLNADLQEEIYMRQLRGQRMERLESCAYSKASMD
jgi:hypothetical protein